MINVKITKIEKSQTIISDTHPIVNDKDYCEVITTAPKIHYEYDGCQFAITGKKDDTHDDLIKKVIRQTAWDVWFYEQENEYNTFTEIGLPVPVSKTEEGNTCEIDDIGDYVNNFQWMDVNYDNILNQLKDLAEKKVKINIIQ